MWVSSVPINSPSSLKLVTNCLKEAQTTTALENFIEIDIVVHWLILFFVDVFGVFLMPFFLCGLQMDRSLLTRRNLKRKSCPG